MTTYKTLQTQLQKVFHLKAALGVLHWDQEVMMPQGAAAMRDYGFDDLGLERIIGVTHPGNRASQHVLTKIGMADEGWERYYDRRLRLFAILGSEL